VIIRILDALEDCKFLGFSGTFGKCKCVEFCSHPSLYRTPMTLSRMDNAFKFDEKSGGLCSEKDYPYKATVGTCNTHCKDVPGSIVKTFVDVPPSNERALLAAIAMQPISIAIQADQFAFQFYKEGV